MKTNVVILLNSFLLFIISFITDYWMYRDIDVQELKVAARGTNDTIVERWENDFQKPVTICRTRYDEHRERKSCKDVTAKVHVVFEYGNLFRECNDLLDGERKTLAFSDFTYRKSCSYFVTEPRPWHWFRRNSGVITGIEETDLVLGCMSMGTITIAVLFGVHSYVRRGVSSALATGVALVSTACLYLGAVVLFVVKVKLIDDCETNAANGAAHLCRPQENKTRVAISDVKWRQWLHHYRRVTFGWSFIAAICCLVLVSAAAYLYLSEARRLRERRRHLLRKRQLETALMQSCRNDVALAIRARMTVI